VIYFCIKNHFWWTHWIILWKQKLSLEFTILITSFLWA
jgi:hypothetical protein